MNKIILECITEAGDSFSVSLESDNRAQLLDTVPATVAAYRSQGIEVISASAIEEMAIDVNLHIRPAARPARKATKWSRHMSNVTSVRPMWVAERVVALSGLVLAIVGFDNGMSVSNLSQHAANVASAISQIL
jgi:hypothetical protein